MINFDVKSFIAREGLALVNEGYSEIINGCGLTIKARGISSNAPESETFDYTFWLFRMPNSNGGYYIWLSCFSKERPA